MHAQSPQAPQSKPALETLFFPVPRAQPGSPPPAAPAPRRLRRQCQRRRHPQLRPPAAAARRGGGEGGHGLSQGCQEYDGSAGRDRQIESLSEHRVARGTKLNRWRQSRPQERKWRKWKLLQTWRPWENNRICKAKGRLRSKI